MSLPAEIAGQSIAPGGPMRVIAEIGLNHNGDADLAHRLVDACADAGAWAMKLQVFDADELLVADAPAPAHVRAESLRAFFRQFQLNADAYAAIVSHARDRGLAVIATAFDSLSVGMLDRLGIDAFKVASGDLGGANGLVAALTQRRQLLGDGAGGVERHEAVVAAVLLRQVLEGDDALLPARAMEHRGHAREAVRGGEVAALRRAPEEHVVDPLGAEALHHFLGQVGDRHRTVDLGVDGHDVRERNAQHAARAHHRDRRGPPATRHDGSRAELVEVGTRGRDGARGRRRGERDLRRDGGEHAGP